MNTIMNDNIVCRGSWVFGSACGQCKRCCDELLIWLDRLVSEVDVSDYTETVIHILNYGMKNPADFE